jgi:DNA-binding response OmpR family regulator
MKKVAIIEDDYALVKMYTLKFEGANFKVVHADNGLHGLTVIRVEQPDIILLDLMMPEMTGDEMLTELRKKPWGKKIPVIVMTNITREEAPPILDSLNIKAFIIKANTTPQMVLEKVLMILENKTLV